MLQKYSYSVKTTNDRHTSMEDREVRGDMNEVYKLLTGKRKLITCSSWTSQRHRMASEDMRRNWQRSDQDWIQDNFSSVKEWSMGGMVLQLTALRTPTAVTTANTMGNTRWSAAGSINIQSYKAEAKIKLKLPPTLPTALTQSRYPCLFPSPFPQECHKATHRKVTFC